MDQKRVDPFMESLEAVSVTDIRAGDTQKSKKNVAQTLIRLLVILVCLVIFIYSTVLLVERITDYARSDELYDSIASIWYSGETEGNNPFGKVQYSFKDYSKSKTYDMENSDKQSPGEVDIPETVADSDLMIRIKAKINALKTQNKDIMGWITVDNTVIDYPIVASVDNTFYLNHAFDGSFSKSGAIFADYRNEPNFDDNYNTVIYGHNLMSGMMFSDMDKFFTKSFFKNNRYFYIYTERGIYVYETFCIAKVSIRVDYTRTEFFDSNEFLEFVYAMKSRSVYKTDTEFTENDRIVTLSTCTNAGNQAERYCLMAKLVEIRK